MKYNEEQVNEIVESATALYNAGYWTCDRDVNEPEMWERLRNSLDIEPGNSPKPL